LKQYIEIYKKKYGIFVSTDWLITGNGNDPFVSESNLVSIDTAIDLLLDEGLFFFFMDKNLIIRRVNPLFAQLLSAKNPKELNNKQLIDVVGKDKFNSCILPSMQALNGEISTYSLTPQYNKQVIINVVCKPTLNNNNQIIGTFHFIEKPNK
jgi:hypothetical protein